MVPVKWCKVLRSPSRWVRPKVILKNDRYPSNDGGRISNDAYSFVQIRRWCQSRKMNNGSVNEKEQAVAKFCIHVIFEVHLARLETTKKKDFSIRRVVSHAYNLNIKRIIYKYV